MTKRGENVLTWPEIDPDRVCSTEGAGLQRDRLIAIPGIVPIVSSSFLACSSCVAIYSTIMDMKLLNKFLGNRVLRRRSSGWFLAVSKGNTINHTLARDQKRMMINGWIDRETAVWSVRLILRSEGKKEWSILFAMSLRMLSADLPSWEYTKQKKKPQPNAMQSNHRTPCQRLVVLLIVRPHPFFAVSCDPRWST